MHIITRNNQYGYNEGISAIDAIAKIERYVEHAIRAAGILFMGLSTAFGAVNRKLLWATLYRKWIRWEIINRIRRGHRGAKLAPKYRGDMDRQEKTI